VPQYNAAAAQSMVARVMSVEPWPCPGHETSHIEGWSRLAERGSINMGLMA